MHNNRCFLPSTKSGAGKGGKSYHRQFLNVFGVLHSPSAHSLARRLTIGGYEGQRQGIRNIEQLMNEGCGCLARHFVTRSSGALLQYLREGLLPQLQLEPLRKQRDMRSPTFPHFFNWLAANQVSTEKRALNTIWVCMGYPSRIDQKIIWLTKLVEQ